MARRIYFSEQACGNHEVPVGVGPSGQRQVYLRGRVVALGTCRLPSRCRASSEKPHERRRGVLPGGLCGRDMELSTAEQRDVGDPGGSVALVVWFTS